LKKQTHILNIKAVFVLALLFCSALSNPCKAQEVDHKAYTLFIYNFMKYFEWPESQSKGDFVIAVMGDSPVYKELQTIAATKKLNGRKIIVKKCSAPTEAITAHLIFIPSAKSSLVKTFKEQTKDKPVLIIGEREGLAKKGAGLSFLVTEEDELKFDINVKDIEQHQLKIAGSLIRLGNVID
jgi:hypothetical protein